MNFPALARFPQRPDTKARNFPALAPFSSRQGTKTPNFPALARFSSRPDMETPTFPYLHGFFLDGLENLDFSVTFTISFAAGHGNP
jgi:hypothetical protein